MEDWSEVPYAKPPPETGKQEVSLEDPTQTSAQHELYHMELYDTVAYMSTITIRQTQGNSYLLIQVIRSLNCPFFLAPRPPLWLLCL